MMVKEKNYLINEAAKEVHVESHVLRYWKRSCDYRLNATSRGIVSIHRRT